MVDSCWCDKLDLHGWGLTEKGDEMCVCSSQDLNLKNRLQTEMKEKSENKK